MKTQIKKIDPAHFTDAELYPAAKVLQAGGLVAFPTETVYGLGGDAFCPDAAKKIYAAKGRPSDNPLIVHVGYKNALAAVAKKVDARAEKLMEAFWPGPLTLVFYKQDAVPLATTGGLSTVAVRMPAHPVALSLLRVSGVAVAAPSANASGRPSPTGAEHVKEDLSGKIEYLIDGGPVGLGIESTILDMTQSVPVILRPGAVTRQMIAGVVGAVELDPALLDPGAEESGVARAPGMKYRHYAPQGELTIVEGETDAVVKKINELTLKQEAEGKKAAVIAAAETANRYLCREVHVVGSRRQAGSIARGLYRALRLMDTIGAQVIYAESFFEDEMGDALMNRLLKAAGGRRLVLTEQKDGDALT